MVGALKAVEQSEREDREHLIMANSSSGTYPYNIEALSEEKISYPACMLISRSLPWMSDISTAIQCRAN